MIEQHKRPLRVAIGGLGAIGRQIAERLDVGIDGLTLVSVSANRVERAQRYLENFDRSIPVLQLAELADSADVVIECAPAAVFGSVAESAIARGRIFIPSSITNIIKIFLLKIFYCG